MDLVSSLELVQSLSAEIGRWYDDVGRSVPQNMSHAGINALKS
jgi:hypothetical protein